MTKRARIEEQARPTEKLEVQVFGSTDWLVFQQLALASLVGGRVGVLAIPDLVAPPSGTRLN